MIQQASIGLNSRSEANPYNKDGFLPLITAPMYSVVNDTNYQLFLDNKIQVCLPRNKNYIASNKDGTFISLSLNDFINEYIKPYEKVEFFSGFEFEEYICIDTANGNIPQLHEAIKQAKKIHGSNLIIMAGNVSSVEAFATLAATGCDYIRVGIGGGGGCNTTSNTGVGQKDLENLIQQCYNLREVNKKDLEYFSKNFPTAKTQPYNISKVKIVADGISTYIKQCETKYGFNDNGYAAINKLLFAGADLVMIGKLFAQCLESAGEKKLYLPELSDVDPLSSLQDFKEWSDYETTFEEQISTDKEFYSGTVVKYSGMSTQEEQKKYQTEYYWIWWWGNSITGSVLDETVFYNFEEMKAHSSKHSFMNSICNQNYYSNYTKHKIKKPSEGSVNWIPVRWKLDEWLNGSENQDNYPYLMGWVNSIKSAMAYLGKKTIDEN